MQRVLVAVDFSDYTPALVRHAIRLARALGAEAWVLHVAEPEPEFVGYDPGPQSRRDDVARELRRDHRDVQALGDEMSAAGIPTTALQVQGPTVEKILGEAARLDVDLIVLGTHGHGALHRLLVGSVGEGVLRGARCPVLFVPLSRSDRGS